MASKVQKDDTKETTGDQAQTEATGTTGAAHEEAYVPDLGGINISADFDANAEFKPTPLIPRGVYRGSSTGVKFDPETQSIIWTFCLNNNGGLMSDGETSVDGVTIEYKNWLPMIGDENELTSSGKSTKRQAKINMLKEFGDRMKIKIGTKEEIVQGLTSGEWIGLSVIMTIGTREYQGRIFNDLKDVKAG